MTVTTVDRAALETKVKDMYTEVATAPHGTFHFEMGRAMAERLGYAPEDLDRVPADEAVRHQLREGGFRDSAATARKTSQTHSEHHRTE